MGHPVSMCSSKFQLPPPDGRRAEAEVIGGCGPTGEGDGGGGGGDEGGNESEEGGGRSQEEGRREASSTLQCLSSKGASI